MDFKKIALLVGALIIAGITAITAKNMFTGASAPSAVAGPAVPVGAQVLVATRTLPVGTIINAEAFRYQPWPEGLVQNAYYVRGADNAVDPSSLIGTVVRNEITAGQPVTQGSLIRPGERGFLAAALGPGMRAVTVGVSVTSGVAGFVFPGDRVDLVLTQEVAGGGEGAPLRVSETIIRNIRVLAVDQRLDARNEQGVQVAQATSTVTFEATPKIAEKIAVAQTIGTLSLSLRSLADNSAELERAIAAGEVQVPQNDDPRAERQMLLAVANQPVDANPTFTVGADVSRFQRSSVPGRPVPQNEAAAGPSGPTNVEGVPTGPVVRIARGNNVTIVPVGAR
ncbi:MAG: Flp pilus assembly protein CpaB [Allosphingosinicella sp.]